MGLCENMRSWRLRGSTASFMVAIGAMLLGLGSAQTCPAGETQQNLTQPSYQGLAKKQASVDFLASFVGSFLYTVQPNSFPEDIFLRIVNDPGNVQSDQDLVKEILDYQVGFLVCIAIGILYIVLMPIIGFFLACCRCCGNCGGKMYQKQTSSIHCLRRTLYFSVFVITIIILAGNICMFRSNEALKKSVEKGPGELNHTISNIHTFLTAVPQQVNDVVNESFKTVQEVSRNIDDIGPQMGAEIQRHFRGFLDPALQSVKSLDNESLTIKAQLDNLNSSLDQLRTSVDRVQANVTAVKNQINKTLSEPNCTGCSSLTQELQKLTVDTTISIPSLQKFQSAVDEVIKADLKSKINETEEYFLSIPQSVTTETKDIVQHIKQLLSDITKQISEVSKDLQLPVLNDVSQTLNQAQTELNRFLPQIESLEFIRWSVCVTLCCIVLLVVVCNLLGLVLGPLGLSPKRDPTSRSCTADCGGVFLMMGAGFSFLFSWLLMIAVLLLFLVGGNSYTLICRPWKNGQLLKFLDTPDLIPNLDIGQSLGLQTTVGISDIYRDCQKNKPLWTTLHLNEVVDLRELLNVSKYTAQIQEQFDKTDITLPTITLLSPELKSQLGNISANLGALNTSATTQQMNNILSINLNTTANELLEISRLQHDEAIKKELENEAMRLQQIQVNIETVIFPQVKNLNSSIKSLQSTTKKVNRMVGEVLSIVGAAQDFLNTNTTQIVKTESRKFLDCQLEYFTAFADWANFTITQHVGRCGPVAGAVDSAEVIFCSNVVESLNAFWLSMGWCLMFFIPSIIFSIKLAKYYRRMKYSDSYEDNHIIMNHIPRAQLKLT
ncbi:prominin-2 [Kryptolebias marmoratus]|uniref:Prominin-1-A-like n=1 Tax=Kryptolebias marmoratus TaxID=37003 RepID=A0A3Q3BF14_KRYMA|nr:prominin-2 [Kryptolebias marmoratus]XP_037829625.1 prominin-2 [Kryptolebias marmoratus]